MAETVKVIVQAEDAASGVLRGITSQFGALGGVIDQLTAKEINWGNVAEAATTLVIDGVKDAIDTTIKYGDEVRNLALASGQSTEAASRMIQVLDDFGLSAEDAMTATKALTKEGLAPTIETLAMLSDKYLTLTTAQEKNEFILKNLGKGGLQWAEALSKGSAALLEMNAGVNSSLVLNQQQVDSLRKYELAVDDLGDSFTGLKVAVGTSIIPALTDIIKILSGGSQAWTGFGNALSEAKNRVDEFTSPADKAAAAVHSLSDWAAEIVNSTLPSFMQDVTNATEPATKSLEDNATAAGEVVINYGNLITSIQNMQNETDRFNNTNERLAAQVPEFNAQMADLQAKLQELARQGYSPASQAVQDVQKEIETLNGKMSDNEAAVKANAEAHTLWAKQTVYAFAVARAGAVDGISEGEGKALIEIGVKLDLFDKQTADVMTSVNKAMSAPPDTAESVASIEEIQKAVEALENGSPYQYQVIGTTTTVSTGGTDTGGGGDYEGTGGATNNGQNYAVGTDGWETVPAGYPNDTYRVNLSSGEKFNVIPAGQPASAGANYFYGNTTFIVSGDGSSFMEQR